MQNFSIMLATLPCDDVVECGEIRIHVVGEERIVVCPWCGAFYDQLELQDWVLHQSPRPLITLVYSLVRDGDRLLQVVGMCPDGLMVKECSRGSKAELFRGTLVPLRN